MLRLVSGVAFSIVRGPEGNTRNGRKHFLPLVFVPGRSISKKGPKAHAICRHFLRKASQVHGLFHSSRQTNKSRTAKVEIQPSVQQTISNAEPTSVAAQHELLDGKLCMDEWTVDASVSETTFLFWFSVALALFRGIPSQGFCKTMVTTAESRQKPSGCKSRVGGFQFS